MDLILDYLGIKRNAPTLHLLDALVDAYVQRIPWESASRIVRRAQVSTTQDCPRWPEAFWQSAREHGTGGTCFESNYAFFDLLKALGYDGYLTINNMGDNVGCHTAIVVTLPDGDYLVDVGLPLHRPLPIDPDRRTERHTPYHTYSVMPLGDDAFEIGRDRYPRPVCFTFINRPVADAAYRKALTDDYNPDSGLFLNEVIVVRVVNGLIHRFNATETPYQIEAFHDGDKTYYFLGDDPTIAAQKVAQTFGITEEIVRRALAEVRR